MAGQRQDDADRDLIAEAVAHYRLQETIDRAAQDGTLADPADPAFIRALHRDFYAGASLKALTIEGEDHRFVTTPGEWRTGAAQDVHVGRHVPPRPTGWRISWSIFTAVSPSIRSRR